jgi:hypothetical protein
MTAADRRLLRVCIECGDKKLVHPRRGGGAPERCYTCSRKRWDRRILPVRKNKKAA